jgi:Tfp pilus assembly protein PilF
MPSQTRTHLLTRWGFTCTCALCSLPTPEKRASDTRRVLLARAEEKILALAQSYRLADAIALTHESIDMILDEDIYPMLTDEYAMLAMLYLEAGERENAERYGRLAWQLLADLGFLGVGEERPVFSLEKLLGNMGRLGGEGKAGLWKRKA